MFLGFAALLILASVPVLRGRLSLLGSVAVRGAGVLMGTLLVQIVITDVPTGLPSHLLAALHVLTYVAAAWVIVVNRRLPGLLLLAAGAGLNALAIAVNGGTLPASASALRAAGIHERSGEFANSGALAHPHLAFLGDTVATPAWLPLRNVMSIGDVVILAGFFVLMHVTCQSVVFRPLRSRFLKRKPAPRHQPTIPDAA